MNRPMIRVIALAAVMALAVVACGQKSDVHNTNLVAAGPGTTTGAVATDTTGGVLPTDTTGTATTGTAGTTTGTAGTATTGTAGTTTGTIAGGDRTGITDTTITIGLHAPLTGAAPIEPVAFSKGKDLYWKWLNEVKGQKVFGRTINVVFRDDQYTPSIAVQVCNQMATQDKAFLLIGGGGTDQINACAGYADPRNIPYFSPGVQETGLNTRKTYFAVSMSYKQQMPLLVQMLKKEATDKYGAAGTPPDGKITLGFVRPNTPNFNDAADALKAEATAAGFGYKVYTVVKEGNSNEAQTVATQLQQDGVDVAIPITAPTFTTQLALNTGKNQYKPLYAGVGITNNLNQMINNVCRNNEFQGALFFSPWPGWKNVMAGQYDKDFAQAANKYAPDVNRRDKGGDILIALWGIMKTIHQAMLAAGPTMSRESFVATMSTFNLSLKVFPDLRYAPTNHFGAQNVHLLKGSCDEPGGPGAQAGAQFVSHPNYPGLRSRF